MMDVGNLFCIKKTFQFFRFNPIYLSAYPTFLIITFLPIYLIVNYHSMLIDIACRTPFTEIVLYSFISLEILAFIPFISLLFLIMSSVSKYIFTKINKDIYEFDFSDFNIFHNLRKNLNIAITLSISIFIFIFLISGLQFLIYIILYISYYIVAQDNFSKFYDTFIFLLAFAFILIIIILTFYLILPILRKVLLYNRPYKLMLALPKLFSLKFLKISFTYDYFTFWFKWLISVVGTIFIGTILKIIVINLLNPFINEIIIFIVSSYIYMLLLTILSVYTAICSIFSKEKLEFPALIEEENEE
ncbi:MAG: hypothetical protein DSY59_05170 [Persephonella sp.]|nr:MAG: hypothetical protein DSY59_05170 [Persephonella sp.]